MILEKELFCLGHLANFQTGLNEIVFQEQNLLICKETGLGFNLVESVFPDPWRVQCLQNVLWIHHQGTNPEIPSLDFQEVSAHMEIIYPAPFRFVMENLFDLNHVPGTHSKSLAANSSRLENFRSFENKCTFEFTTALASTDASETVERTRPVTIYFPGFFAANSTGPVVERDLPQFVKNDLPGRTHISIYPVTDKETTMVIFSQTGIPAWVFGLIRTLRPNVGQDIVTEDRNILTNLSDDYTRKIRLSADQPVEFARRLYAERA